MYTDVLYILLSVLILVFLLLQRKVERFDYLWILSLFFLYITEYVTPKVGTESKAKTVRGLGGE